MLIETQRQLPVIKDVMCCGHFYKEGKSGDRSFKNSHSFQLVHSLSLIVVIKDWIFINQFFSLEKLSVFNGSNFPLQENEAGSFKASSNSLNLLEGPQKAGAGHFYQFSLS